MTQKIVLNQQFTIKKEEIKSIIDNFDLIEDYVAKGTRNSIKKTSLKEGEVITIKSFKVPNTINKFVYRFFRKSKAERSYTYAKKLIDLGFKTPNPIAYIENKTALSFLDSYYICEYTQYDFLFRDIVEKENFPNTNVILRQFAKFTYDLHEAGIEFLDHSPGNTLIKKIDENKYEFYLVDLNRMNFHDNMEFNLRINNFSRITPHKEMIEVIGKEYAKLINRPEQEVINAMWNKTEEFQEKFYSKQRRKKKLKALIGKK